MLLRTNCKNCGAPLHYDETNYGKVAKCEYCRQEYHIDNLGRIEEYKVKLEIMGEVKEFYISDFQIHKLYTGDIGRDIGGKLKMSRPISKTEIKLIEI